MKWMTGLVLLAACGGGGGGASGPTGDDAPRGDGAANGDAPLGAPSMQFPATAAFYQDISKEQVDAAWPAILAGTLAGGFGNAFQLDPSFAINLADPSLVRTSFDPSSSGGPDCDSSPVPLPPGGRVEGETDYTCPSADDDCHLLVYQGTRLYEQYHVNVTGGQSTGTLTGECLAVWDLTRDYWQTGTPFARGDGCNGADAADMPIAPLLLNKQEIAAHQIDHAMRFTIANSKIDNTYYVHPSTHLGGSGPSGTTLPYGARLRLSASFDVTTLATPEAQAIAVALQKYGMFMDDGGNFFVSATQDITDVIDTHALAALTVTDFEMVDGGTRVDFHQQNCPHVPVTN